jgi:hypothetical protein
MELQRNLSWGLRNLVLIEDNVYVQVLQEVAKMNA